MCVSLLNTMLLLVHVNTLDYTTAFILNMRICGG